MSRKFVRTAKWTCLIGLLAGAGFLFAAPCLIPLGRLLLRPPRQKVLHDLDHPAILAAARDLLQESRERHADQRGFRFEGADPRLPEAIRRADAASVYVDDESVRIEFHGGFDHYGFLVYADGATVHPGSREVIPGLHYYSEGSD